MCEPHRSLFVFTIKKKKKTTEEWRGALIDVASLHVHIHEHPCTQVDVRTSEAMKFFFFFLQAQTQLNYTVKRFRVQSCVARIYGQRFASRTPLSSKATDTHTHTFPASRKPWRGGGVSGYLQCNCEEVRGGFAHTSSAEPPLIDSETPPKQYEVNECNTKRKKKRE
jgi:hypothetical protein